jgi:hypothetical protein
MTCYGQVTVTVTSYNDNLVTFTTDSKIKGATNQSPPADKRVLGTYTLSRADTWATDGGTTLEGYHYPASVRLTKVPVVGTLYVDAKGLRLEGVAPDGRACVIRGGDPNNLLADEVVVRVKWPDCGALVETWLSTRIVPNAVTLEGYSVDADEPVVASIDLRDSKYAVTTQDIKWDGSGPVKVHLTKTGAHLFGLQTEGTYRVWPYSINVDGKPYKKTTGHRGIVDLRDRTKAGPQQHLTWTAGSDYITLKLTAVGATQYGPVSTAFIAATTVSTLSDDVLVQVGVIARMHPDDLRDLGDDELALVRRIAGRING